MRQKVDVGTVFYPYRMLVNLNAQISIEDISYEHVTESEIKHDKLLKVIKSLLSNKKVTYEKSDQKRYYLLAIRELDEDTLLFRFAKTKSIAISEISEDTINEITIDDYPNIHMIINVSNQAVLFEKKTNVFYNSETTKNIFEEILNKEFKMHNASVSLYAISDYNDFWYNIKSLDGINEISLTLNSPNLFMGDIVAEDALKLVHDEYNNDKLDIAFKSSEGKLKIKDNSSIAPLVNYSIKGGGFWKIKGRKNGQEKQYTSNDNKTKVYIITNNLDQPSENDEKIIQDVKSGVEISEKTEI